MTDHEVLRRGYSCKLAAEDSGIGEVMIYDEIGFGWLGGVDAQTFARDIKRLGDVREIHVRINSPGGDAFDGLAMYNTLVQHPARIVTHVDGVALSAASIVYMAGDERWMAESSWVMIHNAWTIVSGSAAELREIATQLEALNAQMVNLYAARTGLDPEDVARYMDAETWFAVNAQPGAGDEDIVREAGEFNMLDEVAENLRVAASFDSKLFAYDNVPDRLLRSPEPARSVEGHKARVAAMGEVVAQLPQRE